MPIKTYYSDTFTGEIDKNIREILYDKEEDSEYTRQRTRLKKALVGVIKEELTPRQKEIIMLYYYHQINTVEIAKQLCISPQSVSATMARARKRMFRILKYYI